MPISIKSQVNYACLSVFKGPFASLERPIHFKITSDWMLCPFSWGKFPLQSLWLYFPFCLNISFWKELDMVFDNNLTSWEYFKELPMKAIDFRLSDSFHPHYIKFLKTDIKLSMPHSNTWRCNNAGMCVIQGLESDSKHAVKIFLQNVFPFASLWGKEWICDLFFRQWQVPKLIFRSRSTLLKALISLKVTGLFNRYFLEVPNTKISVVGILLSKSIDNIITLLCSSFSWQTFNPLT